MYATRATCHLRIALLEREQDLIMIGPYHNGLVTIAFFGPKLAPYALMPWKHAVCSSGVSSLPQHEQVDWVEEITSELALSEDAKSCDSLDANPDDNEPMNQQNLARPEESIGKPMLQAHMTRITCSSSRTKSPPPASHSS